MEESRAERKEVACEKFSRKHHKGQVSVETINK